MSIDHPNHRLDVTSASPAFDQNLVNNHPRVAPWLAGEGLANYQVSSAKITHIWRRI